LTLGVIRREGDLIEAAQALSKVGLTGGVIEGNFDDYSSEATVWIAVEPPPKAIYSVERYLQAIGDAAINGARWVVALDDDL
jgi:hypothetical protein